MSTPGLIALLEGWKIPALSACRVPRAMCCGTNCPFFSPDTWKVGAHSSPDPAPLPQCTCSSGGLRVSFFAALTHGAVNAPFMRARSDNALYASACPQALAQAQQQAQQQAQPALGSSRGGGGGVGPKGGRGRGGGRSAGKARSSPGGSAGGPGASRRSGSTPTKLKDATGRVEWYDCDKRCAPPPACALCAPGPARPSAVQCSPRAASPAAAASKWCCSYNRSSTRRPNTDPVCARNRPNTVACRVCQVWVHRCRERRR